MNYIYDYTFEGFLSCVYHHWYTEKADGIFPEGIYQLDLCRYAMTIETDQEKAGRVLDAVTEKISKWDAQRVYQVFCSNDPEKEMNLLRYLEFGFKSGSKIRLLHGNPVVKAVEKAEQRVFLEVHRMCGLIRFSEVRNRSGNLILYSKIEPDNDILEFLAPHFTDRFKSEPIIIHDLGREKALFAFEKKWEIAALMRNATGSGNHNAAEPPLLESTESELCYSSLWKNYFEVMATRERINPKCQRQFMPARYWKHLTEVGE